jgi:hypothetical protein
MNKTALFLSLALIHGSVAKAQDLLVQTRIEAGTLNGLIDKTRILLKNNDVADGLSGRIELNEEVRFTLDELTQSDNYRKFQEVFLSVFGLDLKHAQIRMKLTKLDYRIDKVRVLPLDARVEDPSLKLLMQTSLNGIYTALPEGIAIDLVLTDPKSGKEGSFLKAFVNPLSVELPANAEPVTFDVDFETRRDTGFTYTLQNYNLNAIPGMVNRNLGNFTVADLNKRNLFSADSISVDPVTIRLNGILKRTISFDTFRPLIQKRMNGIIASIFSELGESLKTTIGPKILASVFNNTSRSDLIIENESIYTRYLTSSFLKQANNQLAIAIKGELCTAKLYQTYGESCHNRNSFPAPVRTISEQDRAEASREINEAISSGSSDMVLSLSEEYLNRLMHTTIQADLWNDALQKSGVALGPKGAFIVMNKQNRTPELYLDLLYTGEKKGLQSIVINQRRPLRFPLRISTELEIKNVENVPHLLIRTKKVESTIDELIYGIPELDLPSHLIRGLRKKIARMILEMTDEVNGQTAVDLDLPVLKDIDLSRTRIEASRYGRLNILYRF